MSAGAWEREKRRRVGTRKTILIDPHIFALKKKYYFLNAINRSDFNNDISATFYQKKFL